METGQAILNRALGHNAMVYSGSTNDGGVNAQLTRPAVELTRSMEGPGPRGPESVAMEISSPASAPTLICLSPDLSGPVTGLPSLSAVKIGRPYKEALERVLEDLERRGVKLSQKELVERLILLAVNEREFLERALRRPVSGEEVRKLLDELETDLGVEDTKAHMVKSLYGGSG